MKTNLLIFCLSLLPMSPAFASDCDPAHEDYAVCVKDQVKGNAAGVAVSGASYVGLNKLVNRSKLHAAPLEHALLNEAKILRVKAVESGDKVAVMRADEAIKQAKNTIKERLKYDSEDGVLGRGAMRVGMGIVAAFGAANGYKLLDRTSNAVIRSKNYNAKKSAKSSSEQPADDTALVSASE